MQKVGEHINCFIVKKIILFLAVFFALVVQAETIHWHNPLSSGDPAVCGRAWNKEIGKSYARMPERFKEKVSGAVWNLSRNSAGIYILFNTNARKIQVRYTLANSLPTYPNMTPVNHSGVDLYATDHKGMRHWIPNQMNYDLRASGDTAKFVYTDVLIPESGSKGFDYVLFLPTYNTVKFLEIGVEDTCTFSFLHEAEKPVVCYGTSICQGASASRPGMIWSNILMRDTFVPFINLGFSGNALMEPDVFDALAEIDARVFIIDCIPNSFKFEGNSTTIEERFPAGIKKLRSKSHAPIIIAECIVAKDDLFVSQKDARKVRANAILKNIYRQLKAEGVKNLYYVTAEDFALTRDCFLEGTHPNDLGMVLYAKAYEKVLAKIGLRSKSK